MANGAESLLVMRDLGVQVGTRYYSGRERKVFIERQRIESIIINEGIQTWAIFYYMAILVKGQERMVLPFEVPFNPSLVSPTHNLPPSAGDGGSADDSLVVHGLRTARVPALARNPARLQGHPRTPLWRALGGRRRGQQPPPAAAVGPGSCEPAAHPSCTESFSEQRLIYSNKKQQQR
jgi:hypothetical protein